MNFVFFVYCNIVTALHTMVTLVSHSNNLFQLVLLDHFHSLSLVETAYPIVNMIRVVNKEARAT